jgi:glucose/arabinose dehydrogenase
MKSAVVSVLCVLISPFLSARELPLNQLKLPPQFKIEIYTDHVPGARSMALGPNGVLFVGTKEEGNVYAVIDKDHDQKADQVMVLFKKLNMPNGVAIRKGALFVAEVSRVTRYDNIESRLEDSPLPIVVKNDFPSDPSHGWKFIGFGPDDKLYVPVGAPCNVCESSAPIYASITRMDPDGSHFEIFARGVRNTVGFDWNPMTRALWFTDNGRDRLGDDLPPDELNSAPRSGLHFGFPYCHGAAIADPDFGKFECDDFVAPKKNLGPHVAALGMRFYTGDMFPISYKNQIFIAEHGSWNRSTPIGYRVSLVRFAAGQSPRYETFCDGWLQGKQAWGRPVDVLVMPDGALLVSDDLAGAIYRISYK